MPRNLVFYLRSLSFLFAIFPLIGGTASPFSARGYTVLPAPQIVKLEAEDFIVNGDWRIALAEGLQPHDVAVESLKQQLDERFHLNLTQAVGSSQDSPRVIRLRVAPDSVQIGAATDKNRAALKEQAYRLDLKRDQVTIAANAAPGLFYGVQTVLQLLKARNGHWILPVGEITDWPDLEMRIIYWDDAHHLEPLPVLKQAVRQAAFYKINGFSLKLEGHFQFKHAAPIVEPYALSPAEYQELTDYALKYYVQLIPYLDGPAHISFILKHPEYASLREFPESNYEACAATPATYKFYESLFQDLLDANRGSKYFVLSTDEPYYLGLAKNAQCDEESLAKEKGSVGKVFAEFVSKAASYLHDQGRTVLFWGEYPMKPDDIAALPGYMVNAEVYGPEFDPVFKAHGIRQMIFTSTVGWKEFFFSNYYLLPAADHIISHASGGYGTDLPSRGYVGQMLDTIENTTARNTADLMGTFVAGWADTGIHPEVMWLGYATGSAAGWHPKGASEQELMATFYPLFYGPGETNMGRVYQLLSAQGQFWKESWDTIASNARSPIWGDWDRINHLPQPAEDQTLPLPPVPTPDLLALNYDWMAMSQRRLELAGRFLTGNDELLDLLYENLQRVEFNRYNIELYIGLAQLCRQNIEMLLDLGRIDATLKTVQAAASKGDAKAAVDSMDGALDLAEKIRQQRNRVFADAIEVWYKSWYPRVLEANGRKYLDKVDDVKDHLPVRTADMTYFIYRQLLYPLGNWEQQVESVRNYYASAHGLPVRSRHWDWKDMSTSVQRPGADGGN